MWVKLMLGIVLLVDKAMWELAHEFWSISSEVIVSTYRGLAGHRASLGTGTKRG